MIGLGACSHAKLPKFFWKESMRIVMDLINQSHLISLDGDILEKIWTMTI